VLLQQLGNDVVLLNEQPLNEVSSENGDFFLARTIDTFPKIGHWRQPVCNRHTPARFAARETKISKPRKALHQPTEWSREFRETLLPG
jgi:hypothetical protein